MKVMILLMIFIFISCSDKMENAKKEAATGHLNFMVNGEDFVNQGFTDKDGWEISFEKVLINLNGISAELVNSKHKIDLAQSYSVNLKSSKGNLINIATKKNVPVGEYRRLSWKMTKMTEGQYKGYSLILSGTAKKESESIPFEIKLNEEVKWYCKDGYAGDVLKGFVEKGKSSEVEMTFHFDHIFGDINQKADDPLNMGAVGMKYFLQLAENKKLSITQQDLQEKTNKEQYNKFINSLRGIGHSGEQHTEIIELSLRLGV